MSLAQHSPGLRFTITSSQTPPPPPPRCPGISLSPGLLLPEYPDRTFWLRPLAYCLLSLTDFLPHRAETTPLLLHFQALTLCLFKKYLLIKLVNERAHSEAQLKVPSVLALAE